MSMFSKVLRAGEGKKVRRLAELVPLVNALEPEMEARSDAELQAMTAEFRTRLDNGEALEDVLVEAFALVREARLAGARPAALRRPADGWHGPPLRVDRRDEDRRGQDPGVDPAGLPQRPGRRRRARGDGQRLPGHP